jgi:hypothetical protein
MTTTTNTHATHVTKPPRSNRQNLARLEIAATDSQQSPEPISNRQFLWLSPPLPWTQLQHEDRQLQHIGHLHRTRSAFTPGASPVVTPAPEGRHRVARSGRAGKKCEKKAPSTGGAARGAHVVGSSNAAPTSTAPQVKIRRFLITRSAIRNRRNSLKTKDRHAF